MTATCSLEDIMSKYSASFSGQMIGAFVLAGFIHTLEVAIQPFYLWWAVLILVLLLRYFLFQKIKQKWNEVEISDITQLKHWFHFNVLLTGILWGSVCFVLIQSTPIVLHFFPLALAAVLIGAAVLTLGSSFLAYSLFSLPLSGSLILSYLLYQDPIHNWAALSTFLGTLYLGYVAYNYSRTHLALIEKNKKIEITQNALVSSLARASEYRDEETGQHVKRMSHSCYFVALELGMPKEKAELLRKASTLHDIGKIGVSDAILLKPGKLDSAEYEAIQKHCEIGLQILEDSDSELIKLARKVIGSHHECWDGSGYPLELKAEEIPLEGRIAAVCDVFDALISKRPYKKAWTYQQALDFIKDSSESRFDPQVVKAFENVFPKIVQNTQQTDSEA